MGNLNLDFVKLERWVMSLHGSVLRNFRNSNLWDGTKATEDMQVNGPGLDDVSLAMNISRLQRPQ
jgi:anion-transporting  ArsA/GET3 family ATPase